MSNKVTIDNASLQEIIKDYETTAYYTEDGGRAPKDCPPSA